jgi:hypothetical protein
MVVDGGNVVFRWCELWREMFDLLHRVSAKFSLLVGGGGFEENEVVAIVDVHDELLECGVA